MDIVDLLAPEAVIASLKAQNKKQLLQELADHAARLTGLPERRIFETLIERERLGSTGMGQGIAIPHGRLAACRASWDCLLGSNSHWPTKPWTTSRWISCFCCLRLKAPVRII